MRTYQRIAAWVLGLLLAAGWSVSALAGPLPGELPGPLAQRVEKACQRAHQAGLMAEVGKVDREALLALADAPCPQVRAASIYALGEVRDERAVPALIARLGDEDKAVRRISARALGKIGDAAAVEPLIGKLDDQRESLPVRCVAANALGMLTDLRAAHALLRASKSEGGALQASATNALHNMKGFLELRAQMANNR